MEDVCFLTGLKMQGQHVAIFKSNSSAIHFLEIKRYEVLLEIFSDIFLCTGVSWMRGSSFLGGFWSIS